MLEARKDLRDIPRRDQDKKGLKEFGKRMWRPRRFLKKSQIVHDIEAGKAPSMSRKTHVDKSNPFRRKDPQTEMTRYYSNLCNFHE